MTPLTICCADIGSITRNRFGWAALYLDANLEETTGTTMEGLVEAVVAALQTGRHVALGFEAPLFIPLAKDARSVTIARPGEGNRPWSAGAGAGVLATCLAESAWILRSIAAQLASSVPAHLDWSSFRDDTASLFLWEAFVSGPSKGLDHIADAHIAVHTFCDALPNPEQANAIHVHGEVLSLIGAVLLRSGWTSDADMLTRPCLVIRA